MKDSESDCKSVRESNDAREVPRVRMDVKFHSW